MSTVAETLRQAREAKQLTVQQVVEVTKIRTDHLHALEEGRFDVFSAPVYIRGFVRSYSTLLKLNVPEVMSALEAELGQTKKFAEPPPLSDHPRGVLDFMMLQLSKVNWRKGMIGLGAAAVIVVALVCYWAVRHYQNADPLKGAKPATYRTPRNMSGETLPLPSPSPKR